MFEYVQLAPPDPILGLLDVIKNDQNPNKINLGIGVYKDINDNTPILPSVKQAEHLLLKNETTKNYLNIEGIHSFNHSTQQLLFKKNTKFTQNNRIKTVQTPGGTGALKIAADFLKRNTKTQRIWISNPGWANHKNIFSNAGFQILYYPYYDYDVNNINFDRLFATLSNARSEDAVVLHGCCHNPTGIDPDIEQWNILSQLSLKNNWLPLFDFAYQGFADDLEKDTRGLDIFCNNHQELIVCNSYSKNFGLYNERVGACTLIAPNEEIAERSFSQLKCIIRSNYSNPPAHGAAIVTTILNDKILYPMWKNELKHMKTHIQKTRQLLVNSLHKKNANNNFDFLNQQHGMFAFMGLSTDQVQKLQKKGIYMAKSGRVNICGITKYNIEYFCDKLLEIMYR